jgi:hypothetical protein
MGNSDENQEIEQLAATCKCLIDKPGVSPWDATSLDSWASSGIPSHGELVTARFLLAVWNPNENWTSGRFDVMDALSVWDESHREMFLDWAADPWWA